jgi:SulP family sulfate permease
MVKKYFSDLKREFKGYNLSKLIKDLLSGVTVAAVALPLALAFGVSSGATPAAGLVTAIIGGIVIGLLSGASFQISGPTGAMSAILITVVANYGLNGMFVASFFAGVIILLAGIFKLGKLVSFLPTSVVMGFTSGIAIIIAMGQIDNFFGLCPLRRKDHSSGPSYRHMVSGMIYNAVSVK